MEKTTKRRKLASEVFRIGRFSEGYNEKASLEEKIRLNRKDRQHIKYTIQDMKDLAARNEGRCLSRKYIDTNHHLFWKCKEGHIWKAIPTSLTGGSWCAKCVYRKYSIQNMKDLAASNGGSCLSDKYDGITHHLKWRCEQGHVWKTQPASVMAGHWCPKCASKKVIEYLASLRRINVGPEIAAMYVKEKMSSIEIAKALRTSDTTVRDRLRKLGVKLRRSGGNNKTYLDNVDKRTMGILVGTMLGDGSLSRTHNHRTLSIEHSRKQLAYLNWKVKRLRIFGGKVYYRKRFDVRTRKTYASNTYLSRSHNVLDWLYKEMYKAGRKRVTRRILKLLTDEGIATWYCDDGCLSVRKDGVCLTICTQAFRINELRLIGEMFKHKYDIDFCLRKNGILTLTNKKAITSFMYHFGSHIPASMQYKRIKC